MLAIRRILVAVKDLGAPGRPAVRKAAQIAQASNAQVELFHSLATPLYADLAIGSNEGLEGLEREVRQNALRRLERIASALRKRHIKVSVAAEWDYPVYDAIIRRAARIKADLIVAAAHAGSHLMPGLMRLTDWELVRLSPMPLLLVKTAQPYRRPAVLVAVDPTHAFAKPLKLDQALLECRPHAEPGTGRCIACRLRLLAAAQRRRAAAGHGIGLLRRAEAPAAGQARRGGAAYARTAGHGNCVEPPLPDWPAPGRCDLAGCAQEPQRHRRDGRDLALGIQTDADRQYG